MILITEDEIEFNKRLVESFSKECAKAIPPIVPENCFHLHMLLVAKDFFLEQFACPFCGVTKSLPYTTHIVVNNKT